MLQDFYLSFMEHVTTDQPSMDRVVKHYEQWKDQTIEQQRKDTERMARFVAMYKEPETMYNQRNEEHMFILNDLRKKFMKSTVTKRQATLEEWLHQHNEGVTEFNQMTKPSIYTSYKNNLDK